MQEIWPPQSPEGGLDPTDTAAWRNFNLSEVHREHNRRVVSETRMTSLSVVKHFDVFAYCALCFVSCREVPVMNHFCFQASPKALHRCVVEAISFA